MIQYDKDGVTLFYVDATGKKFSHHFTEGAPYNDMLNVRDAQLQAGRENNQARALYDIALGSAQYNVNSGITVTAPAKPSMKMVSDTGEVTFVPFDPPLADLTLPTTPTPAPSTGIQKSGAADAAKQMAVLYNMVLAMFRKMFPDA